MASILVIEDGTGKADANSYVSAESIRTYAVNHGVTLPAAGLGVDPVEILAIKAKDFIESKRAKYQGTRTVTTQALQWPRAGVVLDERTIDVHALPTELTDAQCQLACDAYSMSLMPSGDGREVIEDTIGPLTKRFSPGSGGAPRPKLHAAMALLKPLFRQDSCGGILSTVRV